MGARRPRDRSGSPRVAAPSVARSALLAAAALLAGLVGAFVSGYLGALLRRRAPAGGRS